MQPSGPFEPAPSGPGDLARTQLGAREAEFDSLFERISPTLFAWARLRVGATLRGRVDAEDIVQEVWVRAAGNFASFDCNSSAFRPWLLGIARNVVLQAIEHHQRERRAAPTDAASRWSFSKVPDEATAISRRVARDEGLAKLLAWIESLPSDERLLLVLCGLEGRTAASAGERLGVSSETATKRWQRLRARLAEQRAPAEWLT
jgi:RNA polymerase sigma-70 factor (ECF subfamily)